jgi:hypothetical protein
MITFAERNALKVLTKDFGLELECPQKGYSSPIFAKLAMAFEARESFIAKYGFVILGEATINSLTNICHNKKVVDVGSGLGYLSHRLHSNGIDITAIDFKPTREFYSYLKRSNLWKLDYDQDARDHDLSQYEVIILCWPPYDTSFGYEIASRVQPGQILIYQGEEKGGCTADDNFFDLIYSQFEEFPNDTDLLNQHHSTFLGIHDYWTVYQRRK